MNNYEVVLRLVLAAFAGGLLGYEREFKNRPAGLRTHILVCVGAAIISIIQLYIAWDTMELIKAHPQIANSIKADIGRMSAQVVSGIGFLGAGTIIHEKGSVKGLTTAASLWTIGCIGIAIGMGYYFLATVSTGVVYFTLVSLKKFEFKVLKKVSTVKLLIEYHNNEEVTLRLNNYFKSKNIVVKDSKFLVDEKDEDLLFKKSLYVIVVPRNVKVSSVIGEIKKIDQVVRVSRE
ncbi:MgtC/SapB family protein [Clostridium sp. MB40-C1]|uniref:MgtC/SapB family protein n=1 Tax=Clostridium sp. MB40-C1 TaxID=3070996 RepID=UPI0027E00880|nr:MgtC/SapB family protein [Clostridium sp. MB40-C1]WMJ79827.1 MgtC/SapB family protein [Clostridium sp. MB40-C1]